ncbi:MAG: adenylyltransferase/cytidyltransferase family protein [Candidatus Hydrogenedentes bacterium]|nr:adenylyltransferase/cytidyltransferase family protein [Candidatus Hydrogenedentota bacterium]
MTNSIPEFSHSPKETTIDQLIPLCRQYRRQGKRIVWTNGCFEILHAGHIEFLLKAARLGDVFIVGVNSDASVAALKGPGHPVSPQWERILVLSAVECVTHITVFDEPTCTNILKALQPEVYAKGLRHIHGELNAEERMVVEESGGCIALIGGDKAKSTTNIIRRIRETNDGQRA